MNITSPTGSPSDSLDAVAAVTQWLDRKGGAAFLSDLRNALLTTTGLSESDIASAVDLLEGQGLVLVREYYWPDPHLDGEDLRIVGLVRAAKDVDGVGCCIANMEATWGEWLTAFQADHRCS